MGTIKAKINDDLAPEFFEFSVYGYGKPADVLRWGIGGYIERVMVMDSQEDIWYLNSAGYAQRFDPKRPPFSNNSLEGNRLLLIPQFDEQAVMAELAARRQGE